MQLPVATIVPWHASLGMLEHANNKKKKKEKKNGHTTQFLTDQVSGICWPRGASNRFKCSNSTEAEDGHTSVLYGGLSIHHR